MSKRIITDYMAGQIGDKYYESVRGKLEYIAEICAIDDNDNNQRYKIEPNDHGLSWSAKECFDHFERELPDEESESDEGMERITDITQVRPGDIEVTKSGNRYKVIETDSTSDTSKLKVNAIELGGYEPWLDDAALAYALRQKPKVPAEPTEAEIEAGAMAIFRALTTSAHPMSDSDYAEAWNCIATIQKDQFKRQSQAVLEAARKAVTE